MTTRRPDDARDADGLRDPRVEAAWRAHSREVPPPALDDAIRAAARRETRAGPRPVDDAAYPVPSALRPQRWWWPLAAAATIGAIAIGVLQLADHVGTLESDQGVVSDTPAAPERLRRRAEAAREGLPPAEHERARKRAAGEPVATPSGSASPAESSAGSSNPAASKRSKNAAEPAPPNVRTAGPASVAAAPPASNSSTETAAGAAGGKTPRAVAGAVAPAPAAEPFPADAARRDAKETSTAAPSKAERAVGGALAETPAPAEQARTREAVTERAPSPPAPRAKALGSAASRDSFATAPTPAAGGAVTPPATPPAAAPLSARRTRHRPAMCRDRRNSRTLRPRKTPLRAPSRIIRHSPPQTGSR